MPLYAYQAFSKDGKKTSGLIDANTPSHAKEQLIRQGLFPTTITQAPESSRLPWYKRFFVGRVSAKEKIDFTRQLTILLKAGIPLLQSIELLTDQMRGRMRTILKSVREDLQEGISFANSLGKFPDVFDKIYVQLVRAGEASGKLEPVLERLISFFERREVLRKRVQSALFMPIIQVIVAVLVVVMLITFVVPQIVKASPNKVLPWPTRIILSLSKIFSTYGLLTLGLLVGLFVAYKYIQSTTAGARAIDRIKLKIPGIGYFSRINAVVQFCQTLGLLIASGVNLSESLDIVCSIINNRILADALLEARDKIIKQGKIAQYLKQTNLFPPIAIYMINTGEESGQLDTMLTTVAKTYEENLGEIADKLTAALSPAILIFMAIAVLFIIAAIGMPMMNMMKGFTR